MIFNWEFYINKYRDLKNVIKSEDDAFVHWQKYGKYEKRIYNDIPILFDWKNYLEENKDLKNILNEDEAWKHFLYYGNIENRYINNNWILVHYCV